MLAAGDDVGQAPRSQGREKSLRQAPASPRPRDPLSRRLQVHHVTGVRAPAGSAAITSLQGGSRRSYGAPGSNRTWTPMPPSVSRLAANAGWLASWGLQCGTTTTGTPYPAISHSSPTAKLSAWPCANLLTLLNVSGHASTTSAAGAAFPVPGNRYSDRTGSPVSCSSSPGLMNLVPAGVENTTTRHPAAWHRPTSAGTPSGAGAPLTTRSARRLETAAPCYRHAQVPHLPGCLDNSRICTGPCLRLSSGRCVISLIRLTPSAMPARSVN